tara:strand:+ start:625 stop:1482 length:858 start_codon:yes stop_codon:yes gene_type:complete
MLNQKFFWISKIDAKKLGGYVYGLVDPRYNSIFYIGKGGGLEGQGNFRPEGHLEEAQKFCNANDEEKSIKKRDWEKVNKIKEIWESGNLVELILIRRAMSLTETDHVEAALIDACKYNVKPPLTNIVDGSGIESHGLLTKTSAIKLYSQPVKVDREINNVWLFNIKKAIKRGENYYDATIRAWGVGAKHRDIPGYAVGLEDGFSRVVIKINQWVPDTIEPKKYAIDGVENNSSEIGSQLYEKDFKAILDLKKGSWGYGKPWALDLFPGKVQFIRGNVNQDMLKIE